jgi:aspartate aminotransferase
MKLSRRISSVSESATIAITALARRMQAGGADVVSFGAGEPDFDTPQFIKDAAKAALDAGDTRYTPRSGDKLLAAICDKLDRENGLRYAPDQVVVTFGAKHALYSAFQVLIDEGEEVLIPAPYWVSYVEMVKLAGGRPVVLPARRENGFKIDPGQLLAAAGKKTRVFVLNSPCNPTGATYGAEELAAIARAVLQTGMIVFSDEIYEKLVYGRTRSISFATLDPALPGRTVTFNGLAKTFSMPGWRLGWAAGPREIIAAMRALLSHSTTNPVSFAQAAALAAYVSPRSAAAIEEMRRQFELRGRRMTERLNAIPGVACVPPEGAFYCFPDVSAHYGKKIGGVEVKDSTSFAKAALEAAQVALVPGVEFGEDRCVRLSFATGMEQIDKGLDRLQKMLK